MYKQSGWMKSKALLASLLLVIGVTVGGTLAYIVADSGSVKNTFTPSVVTTEVVEDFNETTKSNVYIKNTGDTTAYIRAAVVVTWQDKDGNVYGQKPKACEITNCEHINCGKDYAISYNLGTEQGENCWKKGADGFWYWSKPVAAGDSTGILISSCTQFKTVKVGETSYSLAVEIIGSGIQSVPTSVVTKEWSSGVSGVSDDGTLTIIKGGNAQ